LPSLSIAFVMNSDTVVVAPDMPNFAIAPMAKPAVIAALRDVILSEMTPLNMRTT
jgi:hypothetical protein